MKELTPAKQGKEGNQEKDDINYHRHLSWLSSMGPEHTDYVPAQQKGDILNIHLIMPSFAL